jgi:hypothetical protein
MERSMKKVMATSRWALAVLVAMATVGNESGAQEAEILGVKLLAAGSEGFDALLRTTPSKVSMPQFARSSGLRGALIVNDSGKAVVAFAVRWRITHPDGTVSDSFEFKAAEPGNADVLTARQELLAPSARAFITPGVHWTKDLGHLPSVAARPSAAKTGDAVLAELDCVVLEDGTADGPNRSRLLQRLSAERRGQIDETEFIAAVITEGRPDDVVRRILEGHVQRGRAAGSRAEKDWYVNARGRQALRMAVILHNDGRAALQKFASSLVIAKARNDSNSSR